MGACSAVGCQNRSECGIKMRPFPRDGKRNALWAANVKRNKWEPGKSSRLCDAHFTDDQYYVNANGNRRLKSDAMPTVFAHALPQRVKRRPPPDRQKTSKLGLLVLGEHSYAAASLEERPQKKTDSCRKRPPALPPNPVVMVDVDESTVEVETLEHDLHMEVIRLKKSERLLEAKLKSAENRNGDMKRELESKKILGFLNADQVRFAAHRKMRGHAWSNETIEEASQLRLACGTSGYGILLQQGYPLPAIRTLQMRTDHHRFFDVVHL